MASTAAESILFTQWRDCSDPANGQLQFCSREAFLTALAQDFWVDSGNLPAEMPGLTMAIFRDGQRDLEHLQEITGLLFEQRGDGVVDPNLLYQAVVGWAHVAWYAANTRDPTPRWRLWLPLATPIRPGEYQRLITQVQTGGLMQPASVRAVCEVHSPPIRQEGALVWSHADAPLLDTIARFASATPPLADVLDTSKVCRLGDIAGPSFDRMVRRALGIEKAIPVPWKSMQDEIGGGLRPGLLVDVGGTGTGKTQFALQLGLYGAKQGFPTLYLGLELSKEDIVARCAGIETGSWWSTLVKGEDLPTIQEVHKAVAPVFHGAPMHVMEASPYELTPQALDGICRAFADKYQYLLRDDAGRMERPFMVILDFMQIVGGDPTKPSQPLRERIQQIAYAARSVARELDAVVLLISSTAREHYRTLRTTTVKTEILEGVAFPVGREEPATFIGLGKESGEIEFGADTLFVQVQEPGNGPLKPTRPNRTVVSVAIAKQRAGRTAWFTLEFDGNRFYDLALPAIAIKLFGGSSASAEAPVPPGPQSTAGDAVGSGGEAPQGTPSKPTVDPGYDPDEDLSL